MFVRTTAQKCPAVMELSPAGSARRRDRRRPCRTRSRFQLEGLEDRCLLSITEFPIPTDPTGGSGPDDIAAGPDGNLWFSELYANQIGEINPKTDAISEFALPSSGGTDPAGIAAGPDGNVWFTLGSGSIGVINPTTHAIKEFPIPGANPGPRGITAGPDGNLWFTEFNGDQIGEIDPKTDAISEFTLPTGHDPSRITAGPDGNVWFTDGYDTSSGSAAGLIGMINPTTDAISEFAIPSGHVAQGITAGPDGNLWFTEVLTEFQVGRIGEINPTTDAITEFAMPTTNSSPYKITAGPDGNLWFTDNSSGQIGEINPTTDAVTEFTIPYANASPGGITAGPDGNIWFTDGDNSIGVDTLNADHFVVTQPPPASVSAGTSFGLTVEAEDSSGNLDSSFNGTVTVALANNPGGSTLGGTLSTAASNGTASFSGLTLNTAATGYTLQVSASGVDSATTSDITVTPAPASQLVITQQPPASVIVGSGFGLQASIEDPYGNVETRDTALVTLALSKNPGSDTLGGTLSVPASQGVAAFSGLTLNSVASGYTLQVSSSGLTGAMTNPITVTPVPAQTLVITPPPPSTIIAGTPFGLTVDAEDDSGELASTFNGTVTVTLENNSGGGTLGGTLTATASDGVAIFSGLTLTKAASGYTLQVSSSGLSGATSSPIRIDPAPASQLLIAQEPPSSVTAGSGFGVQAIIEDPYDNVETSDSGAVTVALANNSSGATLGGTVSVTASKGVASFSGLTLTTASSGYTLQLSSGTVRATTSAVAVTPGAPAKLILATELPGSLTAGSAFGLTVDIEDSYGNVTAYTGGVSVAIATGPVGATLGGQTSATATGGVATFAGLALTEAGSYSLEVSSGGLSPVTFNAINVTAAAPSQLVVTTQPPASVAAGTGFGLVVSAEDRYGNPTPAFGGNVSVSSGSGAVGGTTAIGASDGTAGFSGLILDRAGMDTLTVSSSGLGAVTTGAITVTAGSAVQLTLFSKPPTSVTAGAGFGFVVEAEDSFGNVATSFVGTITAALLANPGNATLFGTATATASQGVAAFSGLTLNTADTGYTFQVSSGGLTGATTHPLSVTPAAAARLAISTQPPGSVTAGDPFGLSVAVEDPYGNVATTYSGPVAIALSNNPAGSALGGILTASASDGQAVFAGLSLETAASDYTIQAASGSLGSATTGSIDVAPAAATNLVVSIPPPSTMTAGASFGLAIAAMDPYGNPATGFTGNVTIALASHPGDATAGIANFHAFLNLDTAASGYTIQAASDGLASATTGMMTVIPAAATHLVVVAQPPSSLTAGGSFGLVVAAEDPFGNIDTNFDGHISIAPAGDAGATLGGNSTVTASQGVVAFNGLTLTPTSISAPLEITSPGLIGATTNTVGVITPAQLEFTAGTFTVNENAGAASIPIVRSGGFSGAVSVDVATSGGTASPGVNYTPINQVVGFAAGQDSQNITIPVKDDGVATADLTVSIVLRSPGTGALLGSPSTAALVIHNVDQTRALPALVTVDQVQPVMNANGQVIEILVGFSGGVNATQAQKKSTYRITLAGKGGSFRARNARVIKLRSAVYKATSDMVDLDLKGQVALGEPLQLVVDGVGPSGLHDSDGRLIDGNDDGQPGSNAVASIRPGDVTDSALAARTAAVDWLLSRPFFK